METLLRPELLEHGLAARVRRREVEDVLARLSFEGAMPAVIVAKAPQPVIKEERPVIITPPRPRKVAKASPPSRPAPPLSEESADRLKELNTIRHSQESKSHIGDRVQDALARGNREEVVRLCLPLIKSAIGNMKLPDERDREQAINDAMLAVWEATERYSGQGKFSTFIWKRIRGAAIDGYRVVNKVSRHDKSQEGIREISARFSTRSIDEPLNNGSWRASGGNLTFGETIEDKGPGPEEAIIEDELRERQMAVYRAAVAGLKERDQAILQMRLEGETLNAIAKQMGVSESRICQIMTAIEERLRRSAQRIIADQGGELDDSWRV